MLKSRIVRIALVAMLLVVALLGTAWFSRNIVAASIMRSVASSMLGVTVDVSSVNIDPFGLAVTVNGLKVSNPPTWKAPSMLEVEKIAVQVSKESTADNIVVDFVELNRVGIWFIRDGSQSNVSEIVDNISADAKKESSKPADTKSPSANLLLRRLTMTDVSVYYGERTSSVGNVPLATQLSRLEVKDITAKTAGKDLAQQLVGQIFEATVVAIVKDSGNKLPAMLGSSIMSSVQAGGKFSGEAMDALSKSAKGAGDAVGGLIKGVGDAFGGKK